MMRKPIPRRRRFGDPLSSPRRVEQLLNELIRSMGPDLASYLDLNKIKERNFDEIIRLLQTASNFIRAKTSGSTAKSIRFPDSLLSDAVAKTTQILDREAHGRISFRTFADNNLRILACPDDIKALLEKGSITLFEALQLKRLSAETLAVKFEDAVALRAEFLNRCRREQWIAHRLRREIDVKLGKGSEVVSSADDKAIEPKTDPYPLSNSAEIAQSLFSEQIALMIDMLREIDRKNIGEKDLDGLFEKIDDVLLHLQKIQRKQRRN